MEDKAYYIARQNECIEERENQKVAMIELFDLIAGSETGGIIAAMLVAPAGQNGGEENKYWATDAADFFEENVDTLYRDRQIPVALKLIITVLSLGIIGYGVYYKVNKKYQIPGFSSVI